LYDYKNYLPKESCAIRIFHSLRYRDYALF